MCAGNSLKPVVAGLRQAPGSVFELFKFNPGHVQVSAFPIMLIYAGSLQAWHSNSALQRDSEPQSEAWIWAETTNLKSHYSSTEMISYGHLTLSEVYYLLWNHSTISYTMSWSSIHLVHFMKYDFTVHNNKFMYKFWGTSRLNVLKGAFQALCTASGRHQHVNFPDAKYEAKGQTKPFPIRIGKVNRLAFKPLPCCWVQ